MNRKKAARIHRLRQVGPAQPPLIRSEEILDQLYDHHGGMFFLNAFSRDEIYRILDRCGVSEGFVRAGFAQTEISIDTSDAFKHVLRVHAAGDDSTILAELVARTGCFCWEELGEGSGCPDLLVIDWVLLQNPRGVYDASKPQLPGQKHPGLGIGRNTVDFFVELARGLNLEGIVAHPQYYHSAVIYSRTFRYVHPEAEGQLAALRRDLGSLSLAEAAWAVHDGRVRVGRRKFNWVAEEQVMPLSDRLAAYFESPKYKDAVQESMKKHRYFLSTEPPPPGTKRRSLFE
ncbi:MAG: hypothetical protein AB1714_29875 [Acidobacteriota bacterium]